MEITLQYFDGCPNWRLAEQRLRDALRLSGTEAVHRVVHERVETPEQAEERGFHGSPTILLDGRDPFGDDVAPVGLSCRMYRTDAGPDGAPSMSELASLLSG